MLKFNARSTTAAAKERLVIVIGLLLLMKQTGSLSNPASSPIRLKCEFNVTVCMNDSNMLSLLLAE